MIKIFFPANYKFEVKMKFLKSTLTIILVLVCLFMCGCKDKNLIQPTMERDNYNTGGNLTFVYDEISHLAIFGGEGEVVQFYQEDIAKGWKEKGNRIGFQIFVPKGVKDYKSGCAYWNGEKLNPDDYITLQEGQNLVASFQPLVDKNKDKYDLKIVWEDGKNEQMYNIVIASGTFFMNEVDLNGSLEEN